MQDENDKVHNGANAMGPIKGFKSSRFDGFESCCAHGKDGKGEDGAGDGEGGLAKEARSFEILDRISDDMGGGMKEGGHDNDVADIGVKGRHGLVKGDDHVEDCASEECHQTPCGDKNDQGRIDVEDCCRTSRNGNGDDDNGGFVIVPRGSPSWGGCGEEKDDVGEDEDVHNGIGETIMLKGWFDAC